MIRPSRSDRKDRPIFARLLAPLASLVLLLAPAQAWAGPLEDAVARAAAQTDGTTGVAVLGPDGTLRSVRGDEPFPMASTVKVAVAGKVLSLVDQGKLSLDRMVTIDPNKVNASDGIARVMVHPGMALSVANLVESMLTVSDNTATDVLIDLVGGPAAVDAWVRQAGIAGMRVDSDIAGLFYRQLGVPRGSGTLAQNLEAAFARDPALKRQDDAGTPFPAFDTDPRDTSTPIAMVRLLAAIQGGKALTPKSSEWLLAVLARCRTGETRIKGLLPRGTPVAHKTGTLSGITNDVGIVTLPGGGTLIVAAFTKGGTRGHEPQSRAIAEIARSAYDEALFAGR